MGVTIDGAGGLVSLPDFVERFRPAFPIGALLDQNAITNFGQWGPRRPFVPQIYMVDKGGNVTGQFMGTDSLFEGDKQGNLSAAINHMLGLGGATKPTPTAKKR